MYHHPLATAETLADFKAYGFRQTPDVDVTVVAGTQGNFSADAYHSSGDKTYHVGPDGGIESSS